MKKAAKFQLISRRGDRPDSLLFRDSEGRLFLRAGCGAPLVRLMKRDAHRIMRQYPYHTVIDAEWRSAPDAEILECAVPFPMVDAAADA